jgi:hypothetical protein
MEEPMSRERPSLEPRIVAALANPNIGSAELAELTAETEGAITLADQAANQARENALVLTADPRASHTAIVDAELSRDKLKAVLPRLRERLAKALAEERQAKWLASYQRVKAERDALDAEFAETYPRLASGLVDLFERIRTCDLACRRINTEASELAGEMRRLHLNPPEIELTELPGYWPLRKPGGKFNGLAAAFAETMITPYHPGSRWADPDEQARRCAETEKENARLATHHEQATKDQEARLNRGERERFAARR